MGTHFFGFFRFCLCPLLIFVFYRLTIETKVEKMAANTKVYRNSLNTLYIHMYKREVFVCLFVCLFVCSHLEPKLMDGSPPKLTLRRSSKNFFGGDPQGGVIILEKKPFPY